MRNLVRAAFFLVSLILASASAAADLVPALRASQLDGARFDLASLRGHVVLVNFWATWCAPCRAEMPALDIVYQKLKSQGVVFIGVSVDRIQDKEAVIKAAAALHYPVALLTDAGTNGFGKPVALPITYLIDTQGRLRATLTPAATALTEAALMQALTPLLVEK